MSRSRNGNGNEHEKAPPPDPGAHPTGADEPAEVMPLDELAAQCFLRTSNIVTLVKFLTLRWGDDDEEIRSLFEVLLTLLEPVASDLGTLQDRFS